MPERIVGATGRGFLLLDSHPAGCFETVARMRAEAGEVRDGAGPVALIVGATAGYGLAATVAGLVRHGIRGVGIGFERPAGRRTATAGWYRAVAADALARELGHDFVFRNGDAFADATKTETLDLIAERFGRLDYLIYSVAAPRRADPGSGETFQSVIKPIGAVHTTRTLEFDRDGTPEAREISVAPATEAETEATVRVMGGEDWSLWMTALAERGLLHDGFRTVALSYIGSELTSAIYRAGTIGAAKAHLEATALDLDKRLAGRALTSVNGAAVTQASTAIPGIALYVSLLRAVLGDRLESPVAQSVRLWDQLTGAEPFDLDEAGRIRLDRWELDPRVQGEVAERWAAGEIGDVDWFRSQFRALYGFDVPGVDYGAPVEVELPWP
ncbi:enoyl-[acyl-carrier-protein] reductase [NADH] [Paractinoplanes deccanensis]|uniref:trans-2-enoyl-CoA reductase (NAD(+)) n=1 Tax=Paractinoplanes deccanensis TaxID=113561 RepID=A0ABQ3Y9H2_9ACTN|nr:enoyl-[acyl-carrier-protein] reductase FabV [Actinoplanes deccanensis]GID76631.1 enoyl-[acyl-carrier-protein] reductase [NADH] [Actinoplanes deccanensis]